MQTQGVRSPFPTRLARLQEAGAQPPGPMPLVPFGFQKKEDAIHSVNVELLKALYPNI